MKRIKIKKSAEFKKLEEFKQQKRRKLLKEAEEFINGIEAKVHYAAEEKLKNDLSQAIKTNNPEKIKALVEIKADPNNMLNESDHRFHNRKKTMLSYAIFCVAPNAIQALIDAKADINQENPAFELWYHHSQGYTTLQHIYPARTPLEYAIEHEIYRKMSDEENEKQPLEVKQWISGGGERRDALSQKNMIEILLKNGAVVTTVARKIASDKKGLFTYMLEESYLDSKRIHVMRSTFQFFWDEMVKEPSKKSRAKKLPTPAVKMIDPLIDIMASYLLPKPKI